MNGIVNDRKTFSYYTLLTRQADILHTMKAEKKIKKEEDKGEKKKKKKKIIRTKTSRKSKN